MNEEIRNIGKLYQMEIKVNFEEHKMVKTIKEKIETIQEYQKMIYKARKLENKITHRQEIENHIERRYNNFASNTKKMIDKPTEIKDEIKKYFEKWTKHNPINMEEREKWEEVYKPIERIDES
ncbi:40923_t:CDS:2 [Gigaspora margarita]|uniref:40923_t:CDS:1 n=1 Tax=Gigaspora margarita TaxID=4874 RepID=A0ABN7UJD1_GIGMA|nr:40923_t:CDS:2 [Gigaspora margarita]